MLFDLLVSADFVDSTFVAIVFDSYSLYPKKGGKGYKFINLLRIFRKRAGLLL